MKALISIVFLSCLTPLIPRTSGAQGIPVPHHVKFLRQMSLLDTSGISHTLAEFQDSEFVLHIWGSWCPECLETFPQFNRLADSLERELHLSIVNIAIELNGIPRWKRFASRFGQHIQWYSDASSGADSAGYLGFPWIESVPSYILFGRGGVVLFRSYSLPTADELRNALQAEIEKH